MTSLHADDAFLSYYQFNHDPFTPRVPGFKFYPAQRKSVLGQLHHLARYGQLLLLVTGPKGSGKSLLRQALVASTNKQSVQSLVLSGKECSTSASTLAQISRGIEASSATPAAILARAGQLALTGQEEYLLVDDAGLLEDQALEILMSLAAGNGEGRLHVFLFGEAQLAERLSRLAGNEEGFHPIELQPYSEEETREYLSQRLEGAGQTLSILTDEQIEDIYVQSGGWPGEINLVAREVMVDCMLADRGEKSSSGFSFRLPRKHLLALVVALVAVTFLWFINGDKQTASPQKSLDTGKELQVNAESSDSVVEFSSSNSAQPQTAQPVIREPLALASGEADDEAPAEEVASQRVPVDNNAGVEVATVEYVPLPLPVNPVEAENAPATVPDAKSSALSSAPAANMSEVSSPGAVSTLAPVEVVPATTATPAPTPVMASVSKSKPSVVGIPAGTTWYRSQSPERFSLQVLGTRSEASAKALTKENGPDYHYYVKTHQGAPLYVVTYGVFSSRSAAESALKTLPAAIQAGKPWPKSFASIQQEMLGKQ